MYEVVWTAAFTRAANKFVQPHPKYHPLGGNLKGVRAVSVTYHYRITFTLQITEKEIILLDVGSHDEVYG